MGTTPLHGFATPENRVTRQAPVQSPIWGDSLRGLPLDAYLGRSGQSVTATAMNGHVEMLDHNDEHEDRIYKTMELDVLKEPLKRYVP